MKVQETADDSVALKQENDALRKALASLEVVHPREEESLLATFERMVAHFGDGGKYPRSEKIGPGQTVITTRKGHFAIWPHQALSKARDLLGSTTVVAAKT